jgi:hypothetical protein
VNFEYLLVSEWGRPPQPLLPSLTSAGEAVLRPDEELVLTADWTSARVFRGSAQGEPEQALPLAGRLAVTNQRLIWWTDRLDVQASAAQAGGYAATLVTGSLLAGMAADHLSHGRAQRKLDATPQSILGAVELFWLEWIGAFPNDNYVRIGVKEGNFQAMTNISIDLVLTEATSARTVAQTILQLAKAQRIAAGVGEESHRITMAETFLPEEGPGVKLIGWNFVGSTKPLDVAEATAFACTTFDVPPGAKGHSAPALFLDLSRDNALRQLLVVPRRADDGRHATFVVSHGLVSGTGGRAAGGGLLVITESRLIGLVIKGAGPAGPVDSEGAGQVAVFFVDHAQVQQVSAQQNWRGKVTSVDFSGSRCPGVPRTLRGA